MRFTPQGERERDEGGGEEAKTEAFISPPASGAFEETAC